MNILSYFQPIHSNKFSEQSEYLLDRWSNNWKSQGWNPIVLDENYSRQHPLFEDKKISNFNSLLYIGRNSPSYMKQCLLRWFAYCRFTIENGPSVWCDYDVYNKDYTPSLFQKSTKDRSVLFCRSACSGFMSIDRANSLIHTINQCSSASQITDINFNHPNQTKYFYSIKPELFSDMYITNCIFRNSGQLDVSEITYEFNDKDNRSFKEIIKDYNLFHLHGGMDLSKIYHIQKNIKTRSEIWNAVDFYISKKGK